MTFVDKSEDSSWCADHNMWFLEAFKESDVVIDGDSTIDDLGSDVW